MQLLPIHYAFTCPSCSARRISFSFKNDKLDAQADCSCANCDSRFTVMIKNNQVAIVKSDIRKRGSHIHLFRINTPHGYMFITRSIPNYGNETDIHELERLKKFWIEENTAVENLFDCTVELSTWWRKDGFFNIGDDVILYMGCMPEDEFMAIDEQEWCIANDSPWNEAQVIIQYLSKRDNVDYLKLMDEDLLPSTTEYGMDRT